MAKRYLIVFLLTVFYIGHTSSVETLRNFAPYLEKGTYDGGGLPEYKSRYYTFDIAFDHFMKNGGKIVVELGTTRSFVHGGLKGCNSDDTRYWTPNEPQNWDWGAGCFTRVAAECLSPLGIEMHTVDLAHAHIQRCKIITEPFKKYISYHATTSENFLRRWDSAKKIDLLYLDTGDMTPIEPTAQLHLREAKIIVERDLIASNGIILIDDVKSRCLAEQGDDSEWGKAKYSIPYFLDNGFELVVSEYQVILKKKIN